MIIPYTNIHYADVAWNGYTFSFAATNAVAVAMTWTTGNDGKVTIHANRQHRPQLVENGQFLLDFGSHK